MQACLQHTHWDLSKQQAGCHGQSPHTAQLFSRPAPLSPADPTACRLAKSLGLRAKHPAAASPVGSLPFQLAALVSPLALVPEHSVLPHASAWHAISSSLLDSLQ